MRATRCVRIGVGALAVLGVASGCGAPSRAPAPAPTPVPERAPAATRRARLRRRRRVAPARAILPASRLDTIPVARAARAGAGVRGGRRHPRHEPGHGVAARRIGAAADAIPPERRAGRAPPPAPATRRRRTRGPRERGVGDRRGSDAVEVRSALDQLLRLSRAGLQRGRAAVAGRTHRGGQRRQQPRARRGKRGTRQHDRRARARRRGGDGRGHHRDGRADAGGRHDRRARILHVGFHAGRARHRGGASAGGARHGALSGGHRDDASGRGGTRRAAYARCAGALSRHRPRQPGGVRRGGGAGRGRARRRAWTARAACGGVARSRRAHRVLAGQPADVRSVPAARAGESWRRALRDDRSHRARVATPSCGRRCSSRQACCDATRASRATVLVDSLGRLDFPATAARVGRDGRLRAREAKGVDASPPR